MKKVLILSNHFDYDRMITYDAGPGYARGMEWESAYLRDLDHQGDAITIIDNRLTEEECFQMEAAILHQQHRCFVLKIVDPYREECSSHWYYKFLFRVGALPNVLFLSPYQPTELVHDLDEMTSRRKLIVIPYPFQERFAIQPSMAHRRHQIIFSGNDGRNLYPERVKFLRRVRRHPLLRWTTQVLRHPGYPDVGHTPVHHLIGPRYIQHLSQFRFMFLSPSRCGLEFLKYSECAYARCVPVGVPPNSFSINQK